MPLPSVFAAARCGERESVRAVGARAVVLADPRFPPPNPPLPEAAQRRPAEPHSRLLSVGAGGGSSHNHAMVAFHPATHGLSPEREGGSQRSGGANCSAGQNDASSEVSVGIMGKGVG